MEQIAGLISHAIFAGTCLFVPVLFILNIFKVKLHLLNNPTLILAVNYTLLLGSVIFIAEMVLSIPIAYYFAGEYGRYTIATHFFGPYWVGFWLMGGGVQALIPQVLWIGKFRISIICSALIVCSWLALYIAGVYLLFHSEWSMSHRTTIFSYSKDGAIYLTIISLVYFVLNKKSATIEG